MTIAAGDAFHLPTGFDAGGKATSLFGVVLVVRAERGDAFVVCDDGRLHAYMPLPSVEHGKERLKPFEVAHGTPA